MIIGERLKNKRIDKGYTQKEFGTLVGVSSSAICGYEIGKKKPTLSILVKISNVLNVSTDYLLGRDITVFCENDENYNVMLAREDLVILKEIKKNKIIYKNFFINPSRTMKKITSEIKWE